MVQKRRAIPPFDNPEQEAEFWEAHSPLEFGDVPLRPLEVRKPKDRPISIRLTSEHWRRIEELARQHQVGPSTLVRMLTEALLEDPLHLQLVLIPKERFREALERLPQEIKDAVERLTKDMKVPGEAPEPEFLVVPVKRFQEVAAMFFEALMTGLKVRIPSKTRRAEQHQAGEGRNKPAASPSR